MSGLSILLFDFASNEFVSSNDSSLVCGSSSEMFSNEILFELLFLIFDAFGFFNIGGFLVTSEI